jgi:diaminopimelate decarboxylase
MMVCVKHTENETMSTLVIEHLKASDLPSEWARRLQARPEQTVTVRIATEAPASAEEVTSFTTDDPAFGIWQDYAETADVEAFARRLRAPQWRRWRSLTACKWVTL